MTFRRNGKDVLCSNEIGKKASERILRSPASKQKRTAPSTVCEDVLTCLNGVARVRHANTTVRRPLYQFKLQHARSSRRNHPVVLLLRGRCGDHAAAFDPAGLLPGPGSGISGEMAGAQDGRGHDHGAHTDCRVSCGGLWIVDPHRGLRFELAEIQRRIAASCGGGRRQDQRYRSAGFSGNSRAERPFSTGGTRGLWNRAHVDYARHWITVRSALGSYIHALPGFFYAGGKARG